MLGAERATPILFWGGRLIDASTSFSIAQTSISAPDELPHKLKIEVPANRYDLLCHEGLVRALRIFLGHEQVRARPSFVKRSSVRSSARQEIH